MLADLGFGIWIRASITRERLTIECPRPRTAYVQTAALLAISADAVYRAGVHHQRHTRRWNADRRQQRDGGLHARDARAPARNPVRHHCRIAQHGWPRRSGLAHAGD